jgi:hypothetical protein
VPPASHSTRSRCSTGEQDLELRADFAHRVEAGRDRIRPIIRPRCDVCPHRLNLRQPLRPASPVMSSGRCVEPRTKQCCSHHPIRRAADDRPSRRRRMARRSDTSLRAIGNSVENPLGARTSDRGRSGIAACRARQKSRPAANWAVPIEVARHAASARGPSTRETVGKRARPEMRNRCTGM